METLAPLDSFNTFQGYSSSESNTNNRSSLSRTPSFLNSNLEIRNTDDINHHFKHLLPFSIEIMDKIIGYAYYLDAPNVIHEGDSNSDEFHNEKITIPIDSSNLTKGRYSNLHNLMQVNSGFHFLCLQYQYRYAKFIRSFNFSKFLFNLINTNDLGNYVKFLDFQEFTAVGLGKSVENIVKIPNLTSVTLLKCLQLCRCNLNTLLLSESIDTDIDYEIIDFIFNGLKSLRNLDFCGISNNSLIEYFQRLRINETLKIENLSFHECMNIPTTIFEKILLSTDNLKRLDLSHTQITLESLISSLSPNIRLTHLSLRKCAQLGTIKELFKLLQHPSIAGDELEPSQMIWLNIQHCFSSDTLTGERIDKLVDVLSDNAPNLKYLNMNGYANVNTDHLLKISENFRNLESLSLSDLNINYWDFKDLEILKNLSNIQNLKFLDFSNSLYNFTNLKTIIEHTNVLVLEVKPRLSDLLSHIFQVKSQFWRVFNNKGISRRCWVHLLNNIKESEYFDNYENEMSGSRLVEWNSNGDLVLRKIKKVDWLGLACVKVNCFSDPCDENSEIDKDFGNDKSVRGLYKYYALNV